MLATEQLSQQEADDLIRNHSPSEPTDPTIIEIYLDETALPTCMGVTAPRHNI